MTKTFSAQKIVRDLKKEGLDFKEFSFVHEGSYLPTDGDWNYKDVPHLHHIHQLVEAVITRVSTDYISSLNVQKIFGIKFPLAVFNYVTDSGRQCYYTTFIFYALIIETSFELVAPSRTRVTTHYQVGANKFWLLFFPLIRWALKRNYYDLMLGDIPMREQRGMLRDKGYQFAGDNKAYSFLETMDLTETHLIPPAELKFSSGVIDLSLELPANGTICWGEKDSTGLKLVREGEKLRIYSRVCHHEGASLDQADCKAGRLQCPWHGRLIAPICEFRFDESKDLTGESAHHRFVLQTNRMLNITHSKEPAGTLPSALDRR